MHHQYLTAEKKLLQFLLVETNFKEILIILFKKQLSFSIQPAFHTVFLLLYDDMYIKING